MVGFCDGRASRFSDNISRDVYLRLLSSGGSSLQFARNHQNPALRSLPFQAPVSSSDYD